MIEYIRTKEELAENLKLIREFRGLSQQSVANKLHVERSTYSYYEIGKTTPTFTMVISLADVLSVELIDLLTIEGAVRANEKRTIEQHNYIKSKEELAENLKFIREFRELSQQKVADRLSIDRSTYSYYETGKTEPSFITAIKLVEIFDVEPIDLGTVNGAINARMRMRMKM